MTSGKSTIGPILANVLGWEFYDLDDELVKQTGMEIVDIFQIKGEEYFRKIENERLTELSILDNAIISLGGGTIANSNNFEIIKNSGSLIYLKATPEALYNRLKSKIDRPLFRDLVLGEANKADFIERIRERLKEREQYYEASDYIFDTTNAHIGDTVDKIARTINRNLDEKS
ncbi:MAG: shikimate kinase [Melioribacteraceae bacterium]|nr:shikimate kinase [Melioribacteraceae bacterium]MCF8263252.1 shikimate kinase [Melioribacteraceae bacterium]MCF8412877.1 shikimate kinase [Melioribacteraceae bacterium]MCF8430692.1 shikimate kinase [Melioribacteraceae bacterium]